MNRSILIVICDFLLVSLLLFSTVDINKTTDPNAPRELNITMVTNQVETVKDLRAVMGLALDEERKRRDQMTEELAQARGLAGQRETQVATVQKQLQSREQEAQRLQQQQAEAERRQAELQQRFAVAETNLQALNQQLQSRSAETVLSKEKLAAMETEARKRAEEAAAL